MCRVLTYLGKPILIEDLLLKPDSSLIKQTYDPHYMSQMLNLAGFGMAAWVREGPNEEIPFIYKNDELPVYDKNIPIISKKLETYCFLGHIRGVPFSVKKTLSKENVHPFMLENSNLVFAHNGTLAGYTSIKSELYRHIKPEIASQINGNTDTELMFAIMMSYIDDSFMNLHIDVVTEAVEKLLHTLAEIRHKHKHFITSPTNFFITNGKFLIITRFVFDYGSYHSEENEGHNAYHSLWYTFGEEYGWFDNQYKMKGGQYKRSVIFSSEPLTEKVTTWIEVPEYSLVTAQFEGTEINIVTKDLDV